jgi:hypothetical protein
MKLTMMLFSILLLSGFAHAENCYLSQCHTDEDGTVWCNNYGIDCCDLRCLECDTAGENCLPCNYPSIDAAHAIDERQPIGIITYPTVSRELEPVDEGGIGGFGANGGAFERNTLHSTIYEWPETFTRR